MPDKSKPSPGPSEVTPGTPGSPGAAPSGLPGVNPASLSVEDMSRLLSGAGGRKVTVAVVRDDIDAGAPVGTDGRMNLVHYAAWLIREAQVR